MLNLDSDSFAISLYIATQHDAKNSSSLTYGTTRGNMLHIKSCGIEVHMLPQKLPLVIMLLLDNLVQRAYGVQVSIVQGKLRNFLYTESQVAKQRRKERSYHDEFSAKNVP